MPEKLTPAPASSTTDPSRTENGADLARALIRRVAIGLCLSVAIGLFTEDFSTAPMRRAYAQTSAAAEIEARIQKNDLKGAIEVGKTLLPNHGTDPDFLEQYGRVFYVLAERLEASKQPEPVINRARQESLGHLRAAREMWIGTPPPRIPLAISLLELELGDARGSARTSTAGLADHPEHGDLHRARAHARAKLGEWEPAIEDWRATLKAHPGDVNAALGYAQVLEKTGRRCDAADTIAFYCLEPGTAASRGDWKTHYEYARALILCGRFEESLAPLREAARLAPEEAIVAVERAEMLYRMGDRDGAKTIVHAWLAKPNALDRQQRIQALYRRGRIALAEGDSASARADFEAVLALDPSHEGSLQSLGSILRRAGETERARELFERFRRIAPVALDIRISRAAVRQHPRSGQPRIDLIGHLLKIPDLKAARLEFAEFEMQFPGHRALPELRRQIQQVEAAEKSAKGSKPASGENR